MGLEIIVGYFASTIATLAGMVLIFLTVFPVMCFAIAALTGLLFGLYELMIIMKTKSLPIASFVFTGFFFVGGFIYQFLSRTY